MAGLEQMIFPSGDVWMAAYIKDKSEHFELRTADHNGNGFRNLWNCTQPIGRSVEDFPYQEEKILRNALSFISTAIRKYGKSTPEEKDASAHELRLRLMTRAMALCEKNALFLPAAAEIMRIAAAEPEKMNTRALKKIVDNHNVIRDFFTALAEEIFLAPPNKDRCQLYLQKQRAASYPELRFGELRMEAVKPTPVFSIHADTEIIFMQDVTEPTDEEKTSVADVLNTRSPEQFYQYVIAQYLQSQVVMKPCKYCHRYFTVRNNYTSEYCSRPIDGSIRTCKAMGAVKLYDKRKNEDPIDRAYKRSYKTHFARIRYGIMTKDEFTEWSKAARAKRDECHAGKITLEEFDAWLEQDRLK